MISFKDARAKILEHSVPLVPCEALLDIALGLVVGRDIIAPIDLPPFDNSAMDGIAICHSRESGNLEYAKGIPAFAGMTVSQIIKAGDSPMPLASGTCAKIMTGAPIPQGADTVIPVEDITVENNIAVINRPFKKGQHVRYKSEDVKKGEVVIKKNTIVTSRVVALLAALGFEKVEVIPPPRAALLVTGSELQRPGSELPFGKIFDSNSHALSAALKELGINAEVSLLPDDEAKITAAIKSAVETCDILITVGGVSVGDYDYVKNAFKKMEIEEVFHKVAIKPGKPLYFGIARGSKLIFGLPGNPVSCLVVFDQFVKPAILKMTGKGCDRKKITAVALETIKGSLGKTDFLRGICEKKDDVFFVMALAQGSAMLKGLAEANSTIILPEDKGLLEKGETAEVELW